MSSLESTVLELEEKYASLCEQAKTGVAITVQGKVELVADKRSSSEYYRLILGNKPEDYMVLSC